MVSSSEKESLEMLAVAFYSAVASRLDIGRPVVPELLFSEGDSSQESGRPILSREYPGYHPKNSTSMVLFEQMDYQDLFQTVIHECIHIIRDQLFPDEFSRTTNLNLGHDFDSFDQGMEIPVEVTYLSPVRRELEQIRRQCV